MLCWGGVSSLDDVWGNSWHGKSCCLEELGKVSGKRENETKTINMVEKKCKVLTYKQMQIWLLRWWEKQQSFFEIMWSPFGPGWSGVFLMFTIMYFCLCVSDFEEDAGFFLHAHRTHLSSLCALWSQIASLAREDQAELYQRLKFERGRYRCISMLMAGDRQWAISGHTSAGSITLSGPTEGWASHAWDIA